ncbi:hypothetical protein AAGF08_20200 [Algoriphagus sp. SE2]|uniref:hypothetical protein n=1 Tax=Algoriphagus sp. SE2 TaxID=3141536 RepID=UPI0031CD4074
MKNIRLLLFIIVTLCFSSQKSLAAEYILYEFISVSDADKEEYLSLENFWSNIYKQQVAEKSLVHWEFWQLIPSGSKQGSQYLRVSIFFDLSKALTYMYSPDVMESARKAYPNKSEKKLNSMIERYRTLRSINQQYLYEQIDKTKKLNFKMSIGSIAVLDFNKQLDGNYESIESEQFKPFYQKMVNEEKIGHWGLMRGILPSGSSTYSTHVAFTFYDDLHQVADFMTNEESMSEKSKLELEKGKNVRDRKEVIIAKLIMKN